MKGRQILIERRADGAAAAALLLNGRVEDLLFDPAPQDRAPRPEAIYRAVAGRPMKGLGGAIVDLGGGATGFLRGPNQPPPGARLIVQATGWAEPGKAAPVTTRVALRGRYAVLTPGAPGRNVSKSIADPDRRAALSAAAATALAGAPDDLGLILRTEAAEDPDAAAAEAASLRARWETLAAAGRAGAPGLLAAAPDAAALAARDWGDADRREGADAFAAADVWSVVEALLGPDVPLGLGSMAVEPTRALVAVDVNTGGDLTPAAALKANLAAAGELPRQLRLRGLGGQIAVDFAPLAKGDRPRIEAAVKAALRGDPVETTVLGWTPLGLLELRRKRARRPLAEAAAPFLRAQTAGARPGSAGSAA